MGTVKDRQLSLWEDQPQMIGTESRRQAEVCRHPRNTGEDEFDNEPVNNQDLLEQVLDRDNMRQAYRRVRENKGVGGVDNMTVKELDDWLKDNYDTLISRLRKGKYRPSPVLRVEIPKEEKGKVRALGIPTVIDRMIQQAITQVLTPIFEPLFSDNSFGFRPNRSAHDALLRIKEYADAGKVWCVSLDLEKFFDTVNQSRLIQRLGETIADGRVISLIHRFLLAGVMEDGVVSATTQGTPQGGPLSPLLANIVLTELDCELERRGHSFVRYADDVLILKGSEKAAIRVKDSITIFIEKKLLLKVNHEKTIVARLNKGVKYLGHGLYEARGGWRLCVHPKAMERLKRKIREITARSNGWSYDYRRYRLKTLINGWVHYFKLADMGVKLRLLDGWCRRRIRMVYWKQWKKPRTRAKAMMKLGLSRWQAIKSASARKAHWRVAGSRIMTSALNNAKLSELGWATFSEKYVQVRGLS